MGGRNLGSRYVLKNYPGISILTMVKENIFALRLRVWLEQPEITNRDDCDLKHFLKDRWSRKEMIVEERIRLVFKGYFEKMYKT
ncbi:MAG: hypothetical protein H5U07_05835 [Candidatus Aminicenantes bacterium]|nr:hypothetical protein [Candidatus Aminicenantes bacterium]